MRRNFTNADWSTILAANVPPPPKQFLYSQSQEPHRERTKTLLRSHPELRRLIGKNPYTALMILGCVSLQVGAGVSGERLTMVGNPVDGVYRWGLREPCFVDADS